MLNSLDFKKLDESSVSCICLKCPECGCTLFEQILLQRFYAHSKDPIYIRGLQSLRCAKCHTIVAIEQTIADKEAESLLK